MQSSAARAIRYQSYTTERRRIISGNCAAENPFPVFTEEPLVFLDGLHRRRDGNGRFLQCRKWIELSEKTLSKSILAVGGQGSGKTNVISHAVRQLAQLQGLEDACVVLDIKGDYAALFDDMQPVHIGINSYMHCWNLYRDILAWGEEQDNHTLKMRVFELCSYLYQDQMGEKEPFFAEAAKICTAYIILYHLRKAKETGDTSKLNNAALADFMRKARHYEIIEILRSYMDSRSAIDLIGEDCGERQCIGVLGEMAIMTNRIFQKAFACKGDFSIVEFIRHPHGILILDSDLSASHTANPVLTYWLDQMFAAMAGRGDTGNRMTFVLDEFARLPALKNLDMAISLLRYRKCGFIVGLQSVEQLRATYSEHDANAMLELFQTVICMKSGVYSQEYIIRLFGEAQMILERTEPNGTTVTETMYRPSVEAAEINCFIAGQAVVRLPESLPFFYYFDLYDSRCVGSDDTA